MREHVRMMAAAVAIGALAVSGCGRQVQPDAETDGDGGFPPGSLIGVTLPRTSENFILAEDLFNTGLAAAGYQADVRFADDGVTEQQNQITSMVSKGAKVVIIAAVDGAQLGTYVKAVKDARASVIAYDRLIRNTDAVDYYIAYDNFKVGELQGQALLEGLAKRKGQGPYNVELFAGSPDDANALVFFNGAMSVLQPKIDDGTLKVVSGQTEFDEVVTQGWEAGNARDRMDALLSANYTDAELDGVLSPNDALARAIIASVKGAGQDIPVVTGQDSEVKSVKSIMRGEQYSTISKDTSNLVQQTVAMVNTLQQGEIPEINDDKSYDNGVKVVPAYLLPPVVVTKENAAEAYQDDPALEPLTRG